MEQVSALAERIRSLKVVAASMHEGAIHTRLFPEVDNILALPDDLSSPSVAEREAVARQVREYEQVFDQLGYSLLAQIMPATEVSPVFHVVRAAEAFARELGGRIGQPGRVGDETIQLDHHHLSVLTRYSLSIGTPPVTSGMRELVARILFGCELADLHSFIDVLDCDAVVLERLLRLLEQVVTSSLHYCTAPEETRFLSEASEFVNFEGGRIFNRVVITESPARVIQLIENHVFDKFGSDGVPPVRLVDGVDGLNRELVRRMQTEPNKIFVARVTRIPHRLFLHDDDSAAWRSVLGRLILIDCSRRARQSNATIVYTLFPHVARTLRNIQTALAGRPANTQLQLRRLLERFSLTALTGVREAVDRRLAGLEAEKVLDADVDQIRVDDWRRGALFDYLVMVKLRRLLVFLEEVAGATDTRRDALGQELRDQVSGSWMRYFYRGLPRDQYPATVVPGGGRGALAMVGDYHRGQVREALDRFRDTHLAPCRARLSKLKEELKIPSSSTDEIQAAIRQSQLRALSPTQWQREGQDGASLPDHLARSMVYRLAEQASRLTRLTRQEVDRAAFANLTGGAAAFLKRTFAQAGLGALHGRLEDVVGERVRRYDRRVRDSLAPLQELIRTAQRSIDNLRGELDPVAIGECEAMLMLLEQGHFYPTLILPRMAWSYHDVFPEKYFPRASRIVLPLNRHHEMDPLALLARLEELRYLFRRFPEVFRLFCRSMLLVINSPHNPTGVFYRRETVLSLLKIASEYGIRVVDDNSYHKVVFSWQKAREGDESVAQLYQRHRGHFARPVDLITVGATTKGLQGAGDRTGMICANEAGAVEFVDRRASEPHLLSLFMTRAKLETGLAAKRHVAELERVAGRVLDPTRSPAREVRGLLERLRGVMREETFPTVVFAAILDGYEELLRLDRRGASRRQLSEHISDMVRRLKMLRLERRMRSDVEQRVQQVRMALERAASADDGGAGQIEPQGAFYCCVRLCDGEDDRGVQPFLVALSRRRKVDVTYAGDGYVRLSLGGELAGDRESYDRLGLAVEVYLRVLRKYWRQFVESGRDVSALDRMFNGGADALDALLADMWPLIEIHATDSASSQGLPVLPSERGLVYTIEEGRSVADKIFVARPTCESVDQLLESHPFRVLYRRLLRTVWRRDPALATIAFEQLENQYGPLACMAAYRDRQLIDDEFRQILLKLYRAWHSKSTTRVLASALDPGQIPEKVAALHGTNEKVNEKINELMHAFAISGEEVDATGSFDVGLELLEGITPHPALPEYLATIVERSTFSGASAPLNPTPTYVTGATRRVSDYRYGFIRRDRADAGASTPGLEHFRRRLTRFAEHYDPADYICRAVQVGPFRMLLVVHKSYLHLVSDELRLFPRVEAVQDRARLQQVPWEGVLFFGLPTRVMGESYKTGYIIDSLQEGAPLPVAWVAREDATDYFGFFKKSLLTLHNERVKAMGGMPVHGAMITITFVNGLRKTLVFSADSGTGKSETITAMMEQAAKGSGLAAELQQIDILAGDMLSLWRGEDGQVYAFGTETGDFLRLTDITGSWKALFGDLLKRGSYSNPDHPKNPRVTIPGICDPDKVLRPTRVNCFFYINNYEPVRGSAVELSDDPHHVLMTTLVRGLRKNKGTSGDQPSLLAGLEFAGRGDLVTRYRHRVDDLVEWQQRDIDGRERTCLVFRDGAHDVYAAQELVTAAFKGVRVGDRTITGIEHDVLRNLFWVVCDGRERYALDRGVYDQVYEPLVSTFCGNPFVDPEGMDRALGRFAETMRRAKVHTGAIRTQLARPGYEFAGPNKAAADIVTFLLDDEEVNARFQRNKDRVQRAVQAYYGGVIPAGGNLPVKLEGYNLLLLETHESTSVKFLDTAERPFTLGARVAPPAPRPMSDGGFAPALALPEVLHAIADIIRNPDHELDLDGLEVDFGIYDRIRFWNSLEELTFQVLLVSGVITLGSSETELARFPGEVRKAYHVARRLRDRARERVT